MTEKEKKALEQAFGLPEPERKAEFLSTIEGSQPKRRPLGMILRFGSIAAMTVLALGLWGHFRDTAPEREKPPVPEIIQVTTTDFEEIVTTTFTDVVTTAAITETSTVSAAARSTSVSPQTTAAKNVPVQRRTAPSSTGVISAEIPESTETAKPSAGTQPVTTIRSANTTVATTIAAKTTSRSTASHIVTSPVTTTTIAEPEPIPVVDLTLEPFNVYEKKGKIVDIQELSDFLPKICGAVDSATDSPGEKPPHGVDPIDPEPDDLPEMTPEEIKLNVFFTAKICNVAVVGEVKNVYYSNEHGNPYTLIDLLVTDPLKGDVGENYLISVAFHGGYIAPEDIEDINEEDMELLYETFGSREITVKDLRGRTDEQDPKVGDTFLLFLYDQGRENWFYTPQDYFSIHPFDGEKCSLEGVTFTLDEIKDHLYS